MLRLANLIFLVLIVAISCSIQSEPKLFISEKKEGRTEGNRLFVDVSIKNEGEQPAYFVVLISSLWDNGKELEHKENAFGDIFNGVVVKKRIQFDYMGIDPPDSISYKITYSLSMPGSVVN